MVTEECSRCGRSIDVTENLNKWDEHVATHVETEPAPEPIEPPFDMVSFIMDYEEGALDDEEIVAGFQRLIDNGMAWKLQGSYGRMAMTLIDAGMCHQ